LWWPLISKVLFAINVMCRSFMKCKTEFSMKFFSCKSIGKMQIQSLIAIKITVVNKLEWWGKNNNWIHYFLSMLLHKLKYSQLCHCLFILFNHSKHGVRLHTFLSIIFSFLIIIGGLLFNSDTSICYCKRKVEFPQSSPTLITAQKLQKERVT